MSDDDDASGYCNLVGILDASICMCLGYRYVAADRQHLVIFRPQLLIDCKY